MMLQLYIRTMEPLGLVITDPTVPNCVPTWLLHRPVDGASGLRAEAVGLLAGVLVDLTGTIDYQNHDFCRFLLESPFQKL